VITNFMSIVCMCLSAHALLGHECLAGLRILLPAMVAKCTAVWGHMPLLMFLIHHLCSAGQHTLVAFDRPQQLHVLIIWIIGSLLSKTACRSSAHLDTDASLGVHIQGEGPTVVPVHTRKQCPRTHTTTNTV
jgi:hypothetical protein